MNINHPMAPQVDINIPECLSILVDIHCQYREVNWYRNRSLLRLGPYVVLLGTAA